MKQNKCIKTGLLFIIAFSVILSLSLPTYAKDLKEISASTIEVAFSPKQGATDLIVKTISSATKSIRVAAYSFTSAPIVKALIQAKERGVDVQAIVDHDSNYQGRAYGAHAVSTLVTAKIPVKVIDKYKIFHHKFIIVDGQTVETGSFNFSDAAEKVNAENVIVLHNVPEVAKSYLEHWNQYWNEAEPPPMKY